MMDCRPMFKPAAAALTKTLARTTLALGAAFALAACTASFVQLGPYEPYCGNSPYTKPSDSCVQTPGGIVTAQSQGTIAQRGGLYQPNQPATPLPSQSPGPFHLQQHPGPVLLPRPGQVQPYQQPYQPGGFTPYQQGGYSPALADPFRGMKRWTTAIDHYQKREIVCFFPSEPALSTEKPYNTVCHNLMTDEITPGYWIEVMRPLSPQIMQYPEWSVLPSGTGKCGPEDVAVAVVGDGRSARSGMVDYKCYTPFTGRLKPPIPVQ